MVPIAIGIGSSPVPIAIGREQEPPQGGFFVVWILHIVHAYPRQGFKP